MKRRPELEQLSREHHVALKLARDSKRAAESGDDNEVRRLARRVAELFAVELDPHFRVEEEAVLIRLDQSGARDLIRRTLQDHAELRELAGALQNPQASVLLHFAELLAAHVRFEERELFGKVQAALDADEQETKP